MTAHKTARSAPVPEPRLPDLEIDEGRGLVLETWFSQLPFPKPTVATNAFPSFYKAVRDLLAAVCVDITTHMPNLRFVFLPFFFSNGSNRMKAVVGTNTKFDVSAYGTSLIGRKEFVAVRTSLAKYATLRRALLPRRGPAEALERLLSNYLSNLFVDYFLQQQTAQPLWNEHVFQELYSAFVRSVRHRKCEYDCWIALNQFSTWKIDMTPVEVGEGIYLLKPGHDVRWRLLEEIGPPDMSMFHTDALLAPECFFLARIETPIGCDLDLSAARRVGEAIAVALRLTKRGFARVQDIAAVAVPGEARQSWWRRGAHGSPPDDFLPKTRIESSDVAAVRSRLAKLLNLDDGFDLAFRRFVTTAERLGADDRLIDAVVGLDNLLLPDDERGGTVLALRGSFLLDTTGHKRTVLFNQLRAAYTLRNKIVHGLRSVTKTDQQVIDAAVVLLGEVLDAAIDRQLDRDDWTTYLRKLTLNP